MKNNINANSKAQKLLLIGANGFLGKNFIDFYYEDELNYTFNLVAADIENNNIRNGVKFYSIDITNSNDVIKKMLKISPDITILTAALTNVDYCEVNKKLASKINTEGPLNIIKACVKINSKLVFMSTDFIFDGISKNGNYNENDKPNPLSHYAKTKYYAERALIKSKIDFLICRTAILYGWNPQKLNFITWILSQLQKKEKISISTTQINKPTFVRNLAQILLKLIEKEAKGIYHTVGDGALSRYEMALKCAKLFNFSKELIIPIKKLNQIAIRPKNAGLDISKLKNFLGSGLKIYNLDDGLSYMKNNRFN